MSNDRSGPRNPRSVPRECPEFPGAEQRCKIRISRRANSSVTYIRHPSQDVTVISTSSVVLYSVLAAVALSLCFAKELLHLFITRKRSVLSSELFTNDFNELSRIFRLQMEMANNIEPSGAFSELSTFVDDNGVTRVAPSVSLSTDSSESDED